MLVIKFLLGTRKTTYTLNMQEVVCLSIINFNFTEKFLISTIYFSIPDGDLFQCNNADHFSINYVKSPHRNTSSDLRECNFSKR